MPQHHVGAPPCSLLDDPALAELPPYSCRLTRGLESWNPATPAVTNPANCRPTDGPALLRRHHTRCSGVTPPKKQTNSPRAHSATVLLHKRGPCTPWSLPAPYRARLTTGHNHPTAHCPCATVISSLLCWIGHDHHCCCTLAPAKLSVAGVYCTDAGRAYTSHTVMEAPAQ